MNMGIRRQEHRLCRSEATSVTLKARLLHTRIYFSITLNDIINALMYYHTLL